MKTFKPFLIFAAIMATVFVLLGASRTNSAPVLTEIAVHNGCTVFQGTDGRRDFMVAKCGGAQ